MNFSATNLLHMLVFNIRDDEIKVGNILEEMKQDKQKLVTTNLDNYVEIFYASRYKDNIENKDTLVTLYKFRHCTSENFQEIKMQNEFSEWGHSSKYSLCPPTKKNLNMVSDYLYLEA